MHRARGPALRDAVQRIAEVQVARQEAERGPVEAARTWLLAAGDIPGGLLAAEVALVERLSSLEVGQLDTLLSAVAGAWPAPKPAQAAVIARLRAIRELRGLSGRLPAPALRALWWLLDLSRPPLSAEAIPDWLGPSDATPLSGLSPRLQQDAPTWFALAGADLNRLCLHFLPEHPPSIVEYRHPVEQHRGHPPSPPPSPERR